VTKLAIVSNPAAGRGRGASVTGRVLQATGEDCPIFVTSHSGDETRAVRDALAGGADTIVAVGGDGTWSKVANAILETDADCRLAVVAAGTGNDFAKGIGAPAHDIPATIALTRAGRHVAIDVIRVADDYCINVAGFGFDAHVLASIRPMTLLRGDAVYVYTALRELFTYRGVDVDTGNGFLNHLILAVCNGPRFGGQFHIAPAARMDDGLANVIAIHDVPPRSRLGLFASVIKGKHESRFDVSQRTMASMCLKFREPPVYEIDGELRRAMSDEIDVCIQPRALRVVTTSLSSASRPAPAAP
jgi:diacylglycerol kinase (ATP)